MKYDFHPEALKEYKQSASYYLNISFDLCLAFINEVETGIQRIIDNPFLWQIAEEDIRRHFLNRFPYGIYYFIEKK